MLALAAAWAGAARAQPEPPSAEALFGDPWLAARTARLEALDKVTGRISVLEVEVDQPTRFGTLDIVVRACHKRPPELPPDSAAFLEVAEKRSPSDRAAALFSGWMFASSPGLSALEHPVYDVIVLDCVIPPQAEQAAEETADADQPLPEGASASAIQADDRGELEIPEESLDFGESIDSSE